MENSLERYAVRELFERGEIPDDGVLIVHSAFRNLAERGLGAERFVEALLEALPAGTLLMPAMSWRICTPENPYFDELETPSIVGVLSEVFRTDYATARSIHPTHSAAAVGPLAESFVAGHHLDETPVSANSPFGRLAEADARILLLGVWFESCTLIHHAEERVAPDFYLRPSDGVVYQCRDRSGTLYRVRARRHYRLNRDFPKFGRRLAANGSLISGDLHGTKWGVCGAGDLLDSVFAALAERLDGTLANKPTA